MALIDAREDQWQTGARALIGPKCKARQGSSFKAGLEHHVAC